MSQVEIANKALGHIGAARITSLEDATERARAINNVYNSTRKTVLRAHKWNFAIKRVALAHLTDAPISGFGDSFTDQFQLPQDFIREVEISEEITYKIEGAQLLTTTDTLNLKYVADITDTALFRPPVY